MIEKLLTCADCGMPCEAQFRGPTVEAVLEQARRHCMEAHGLTREQAEAPAMMEAAASRVRDDDGS